MFLANPHFSPTLLALGLDTWTSIEMTANNSPLILVIYLTFSRMFTWMLLPGLLLGYTSQTLTFTLGERPALLVLGFLAFLGVTWTATPLLASSSSGQFLVTTTALCASGLLILLKLLFLLVVAVVGSLLLAGQVVRQCGIVALLREIFRGCLSVASVVPRFWNASNSLPISCHPTSRRDAIRENPNLRKLFVRPNIVPPPPQKGTSCSAKLDISRAMNSEKESWQLKERFRATDAESVERIAVSNMSGIDFSLAELHHGGGLPNSSLTEGWPNLKQGRVEALSRFRNWERRARRSSTLALPTSGTDPHHTQTATQIVARAITLGVRLGLDDYEDIHPGDLAPLNDQAIVTRMCIEHSYMVTVIRRLKKTVEEQDNAIREQAKTFVAFKDGLHDVSKRWKKTFDTLDEKLLKTRDAEIDSLKGEIVMTNDSKTQLKTRPKRQEHLCARVDACAGRVHQSFEQSDLFQESAQRQFRRDHQATLARPLAIPSPSGYSSSVNTSGVEKTVKLTRAGKRRILRPAPN